MPAAVVDLTGICSELVRYAQAGEGEWHAAAWLQKPGGRALLVSARSTDGGFTWHDPVSVDSLDRGARGCQRPAPSIAADSTTSYVHVTYFLDAPEGPGLFFSHSMDNGELFHSPVAIVYGERPSRTRVRASGDMVAVAYEDPNTERTRIGLALSRTMGHIFERRLPVSDKGVMAAYPDVAIRGDLVAVSWMERGADGSSETPATMVVRQGRQQR